MYRNVWHSLPGKAPLSLLQRLDMSLEGPIWPARLEGPLPQPSRQVAPEVGAKGLSVFARSPVGWDEACSSVVRWWFVVLICLDWS